MSNRTLVDKTTVARTGSEIDAPHATIWRMTIRLSVRCRWPTLSGSVVESDGRKNQNRCIAMAIHRDHMRDIRATAQSMLRSSRQDFHQFLPGEAPLPGELYQSKRRCRRWRFCGRATQDGLGGKGLLLDIGQGCPRFGIGCSPPQPASCHILGGVCRQCAAQGAIRTAPVLPAGPSAELDRHIGYWKLYATSHGELDVN